MIRVKKKNEKQINGFGAKASNHANASNHELMQWFSSGRDRGATVSCRVVMGTSGWVA